MDGLAQRQQEAGVEPMTALLASGTAHAGPLQIDFARLSRPVRQEAPLKARLWMLAAASSLLLALGQPRVGSAQTSSPPVILSAGLTCTNGVCELGPGNVGTFFNVAISESGGQGPTPFDWRIIAGALPDGLSFDGPSCGVHCAHVFGTPQTAQTTTFTVQVTDQAGQSAQQTFSLTINPPRPLVITTPSNCCPSGAVGTAYSVHFFVDGGVQPFAWSLVAGQFPPGLQLDPSGLLSGTPTTAGTFTFTVRVTDQSGQQATGQFSITIT
jgi:Putative Ig domain